MFDLFYLSSSYLTVYEKSVRKPPQLILTPQSLSRVNLYYFTSPCKVTLTVWSIFYSFSLSLSAENPCTRCLKIINQALNAVFYTKPLSVSNTNFWRQSFSSHF